MPRKLSPPVEATAQVVVPEPLPFSMTGKQGKLESSKILQREIVAQRRAGKDIVDICRDLQIPLLKGVKLLKRELDVPGPETNLLKAIERRKLDKREKQNARFYDQNRTWEYRLGPDGTERLTESTPANVHAAYSKESTAILEGRCKLDPLTTPIRHIVEHEFELKAETLRRLIPFEYYATVVDVLTGTHTSNQPTSLRLSEGEDSSGFGEGETEEEGGAEEMDSGSEGQEE